MAQNSQRLLRPNHLAPPKTHNSDSGYQLYSMPEPNERTEAGNMSPEAAGGQRPNPSSHQGFFYRPVGLNRRPPVTVYRTGLIGYRKKPAKFKFQTKNDSSIGFYRLAAQLGQQTAPV